MTLLDILQHPILNGVGLALGFIGIVLAYVLYRRAQILKEPCWDIKSVNLVRDFTAMLGDLQISYAGESVKNVTVSRLVIWNQGRATIDRNDLVVSDHFRIQTSRTFRILDARILQVNNPPSNISLEPSVDGRSIFVTFDYLDHNQGAVIQIVHDGLSSKDLKLVGSIKGVVKLRQQDTYISDTLPLPTPPSFDRLILKRIKPYNRRTLVVLSCLLSLALTLAAIAAVIILRPPITSVYWTLLIILALSSVYGLLLLPSTLKRPPEGLEVFDEEIRLESHGA